MRNRGWVTLAGVLGLALVLGLPSAGGAQSTTPAAGATAEYAGMGACVACQEETVTAFNRRPQAGCFRLGGS